MPDVSLAMHTVSSSFDYAAKELQDATEQDVREYMEQVLRDLETHLNFLKEKYNV